ncbi:MAG: hypothetical protein ACXWJC_05845 [Croceibacterium sp.]
MNDQFADDCDILVGMFWARLGTDTGKAPSGSVEEIDRAVAAGKPAMIYFSDRPIPPSAINIDQFTKLTSFKSETMKAALVGKFSSVNELKAHLVRDLHAQRLQWPVGPMLRWIKSRSALFSLPRKL